MYTKQVTNRIVELWAMGFSAEETRTALQEQYNIKPCLDTIYQHRHSLTAQHLIDELLRQQERAILKVGTDQPELALKYRNELLKILLPQRIEAISKQVIEHIEEKRDVTILAEYVGALDNAVKTDIQALRARQQLDTAQANIKTS